MKNFKLLTVALSASVLFSICESIASEKQSGKVEKAKPICCSRCKADINMRAQRKSADNKAGIAKREAAFKAYMEKLKKTDPKRYAAEMKRRNEYKALQELRKKDPKAYQAKIEEMRKKQMAEREAKFMAYMEKVKKTDPKRYATEMKRYNEYKELQALRKKDPKAYRTKMQEFHKKQMAEREAAFKARMEKLKKTNPKLYAARMKSYNEYKELQVLRKKDPKAYQAKMKEIRQKRMAEYKARMAKRKASSAVKK